MLDIDVESAVTSQIEEKVKVLRERVSLAREQTALSEQDTKLAIINPLLTALGWDLSDLAEVRSEYRHKPSDDPVDYALFLDGVPALFLEAKRLGANLSSRKFVTQLISYAATVGIDWCVLTDGNEYRFYYAHAPVGAEEKFFLRTRIDNEDPCQTANTLVLLSPTAIANNRAAKLWQMQNADQRVKAALEEMIKGRDESLLRLLNRRTDGLPRSAIASSLSRIELVVEVDSGPLLGEAVPARRSPSKRARALSSLTIEAPRKQVMRRRVHGTAALERLINNGAIAPPLRIFALFKGVQLEATIQADGSIEFDGVAYSSPSTAAGYARNKVSGKPPDGRPFWSTNGWDFWWFQDSGTGKAQKLVVLRERASDDDD